MIHLEECKMMTNDKAFFFLKVSSKRPTYNVQQSGNIAHSNCIQNGPMFRYINILYLRNSEGLYCQVKGCG